MSIIARTNKMVVGKKYKYRQQNEIWTCEFITSNGSYILTTKELKGAVIIQSNFAGWTEFKEPRKAMSVFVGVYWYEDIGKLFFGAETWGCKNMVPLKMSNATRVDIVEVNYTEKI